jgi:hypothetical protein
MDVAGARRAPLQAAMCAGAPLGGELRVPPGRYLGDGYVVRTRRGVYRLRVACDLMHLNIAWWIALAIEDVRGRRAALQPRSRSRVVDVSSYWKHWPCLLPQYGVGRKHTRQVALAPWQQRIVDAQPGLLVRGLIHSDGWRGVNRVRHPKRTCEYVRYQFTNRSDDIRHIFCDACDALGIEWRVMKSDTISVARRDSVARLDAFVGAKR